MPLQDKTLRKQDEPGQASRLADDIAIAALFQQR